MQTRTSRDPNIMHLLGCLSFIEARFEFYLSAEYIPGNWNDIADDLSCDRLSSFFHKATKVLSIETYCNPSVPTESLAGRETGLVIPEPDISVQQYFEGGLASSTLKTCRSGFSKFVILC